MGTPLSERAERMIEGEDWRTTRREAPEGGFQQRQTVARWGSILSTIVAFQNKHHGLSPTDGNIARDTGLSVGQVQYHLKEMEAAGLVKDSTGFPRHLTVVAAKIQDAVMPIKQLPATGKVTEAKTMDTKDMPKFTRHNPPTGPHRKKREEFFRLAERMANLIDQYWRDHGCSPRGIWLRQQMGYKAAGISKISQRMKVHGWLMHPHGSYSDYRLTSLGRSVLLDKREEAPASPPPPPDDRNALEHIAAAQVAFRRVEPERPAEAPQSTTALDREIEAMRVIDGALGPLDEPERKRVLRYVLERLGSRVTAL